MDITVGQRGNYPTKWTQGGPHTAPMWLKSGPTNPTTLSQRVGLIFINFLLSLISKRDQRQLKYKLRVL